jgi:hypothetical protein
VRAAAALAALTLAGLAFAPSALDAADGAPPRRDPAIGYLYPAGGRRGTVVHVTAGGQYLARVSSACVSGDGVRVTVVRETKALSAEERQEVRRRIAAIRESRRPAAAAPRKAEPPAAEKPSEVALPDEPLLRDLDKFSDRGLDEVAARYLGVDGKRQMNAQLADTVELDVDIDSRAVPGEREIRLVTPAGLTNPLRFEVGTLPEIREEDSAEWRLEKTPPIELPVVVDGQIVPGDVDRFRFRAGRGAKLVVRVEARNLVPFLADAVPGWFQAVVAVLDARGREVACCDDWRFDPDPVLCYETPAEGEYVLEIRDALWRGREDFVYRVTVGEQPFVTRMFPLGVREGGACDAAVEGWNLPVARVALDSAPCAGGVRWATVVRDGQPSNRVPYGVDALPECRESHAEDDGVARAQPVETPVIVDGRIARPGETDAYAIEGHAGDEVVAEVTARRLLSPLDSVLRLVGTSGRVLAWNDDWDDGEPGILTHHADSYLRARLPADGIYEVRIADAQGHGGPEFAYRLRIGPPRPDFALVVTPSALSVARGRVAPFTVRAIRRDGFDGDVDVALSGASAGFVLSGARIPAGRDSVRMTLTATDESPDGPVALLLEGRARIGGADVRRAAIPADDRMQAFAYHHLLPAQEFLVDVTGGPKHVTPPTVAGDVPVRIPAGGTVRVRVAAAGLPAPQNLRLVPDESSGVVVEGFTAVPGGLEVVLGAAPGAAPKAAGNAVIEAVAVVAVPRPKDKTGTEERRYSLGFLPAIPFEVAGAPPDR